MNPKHRMTISQIIDELKLNVPDEQTAIGEYQILAEAMENAGLSSMASTLRSMSRDENNHLNNLNRFIETLNQNMAADDQYLRNLWIDKIGAEIPFPNMITDWRMLADSITVIQPAAYAQCEAAMTYIRAGGTQAKRGKQFLITRANALGIARTR